MVLVVGKILRRKENKKCRALKMKISVFTIYININAFSKYSNGASDENSIM